jgi:hypothetical protein
VAVAILLPLVPAEVDLVPIEAAYHYPWLVIIFLVPIITGAVCFFKNWGARYARLGWRIAFGLAMSCTFYLVWWIVYQGHAHIHP